MRAAVARVVGWWAVFAGVTLLERIAYAAGVDDGRDAVTSEVVARILADDEDLADELEPFDVSDILAGHSCVCCRTGAEDGPPPRFAGVTPDADEVPPGNRRFR